MRGLAKVESWNAGFRSSAAAAPLLYADDLNDQLRPATKGALLGWPFVALGCGIFVRIPANVGPHQAATGFVVAAAYCSFQPLDAGF
jgi:hypothetical protein